MKAKRNFWPFGIIAAFVIFISGTVGLIVMAATQKEDLVSDHYYEQELQYQNRIDSMGRANQLGAGASACYDPASHRILVALPPEQARRNVTGRIELYRPAAAGLDRQFRLEPDANGAQALDAAGLPPGLWKVRVSWNVDGEDYYLDRKIVVGAEPGAAAETLR